MGRRTLSRPRRSSASADSDAGARRSAHSALRRLARALESRASGPRTGRRDRSADGYRDSSASQANSERARQEPVSSITRSELLDSVSPSTRTQSILATVAGRPRRDGGLTGAVTVVVTGDREAWQTNQRDPHVQHDEGDRMKTATDIDILKAAHRVTWDSGDYAAWSPSAAWCSKRWPTPVSPPPAWAGRRGGPRRRHRLGQRGDPRRAGRGAGDRPGHRARPARRLAQERARPRRAWTSIWMGVTPRRCPSPTAGLRPVLSVLGVQFTPRHEGVRRRAGPGAASRRRTMVLCNWTPGGFIGQFFKAIGPRMPKPPEREPRRRRCGATRTT